MTPQEKAEELITHFKIILMNEDTDCGCEILCTSIAKKCALVAVDEIINDDWYISTKEDNIQRKKYWQEVKQEIEKL